MRNIWSPASFQGGARRRRYFEGWYFKHSGGAGEGPGSTAHGIWSFIPGMAIGESRADGYSFVQAIEGRTGRSWWFQYPLDAFDAKESGLDIRVGPNRFGSAGISLDLSDGAASIRGEFSYGSFNAMRFAPWAPGVMGPYSFVPRMECNHGLVSLDHRIDGWVEVDGARSEFNDGRGYIEKDWGISMPRCWIWTQSNDFPRRGDSVMLSVARVPWMGSAFNGFLCTASIAGRHALFATWNGSRIVSLAADEAEVVCRIERRARGGTESITLRMLRSRGGLLRAPVQGLLSRRIAEAADAALYAEYQAPGQAPYVMRSGLAGLETAGDISALCTD